MTCELWTHDRLKVKEWRGQPAKYKQVKYNGHRFSVYKQRDGRLVGFEREIRPDLEMTVKRPKIVEYDWWRALAKNLPPVSSIDGELHVPDGNAGDAAHAIAECLPDLTFTPFAVPWWHGADIRDFDVAYVMTSLVKNRLGLRPATTYAVLPTDSHKRLLSDACDLDIEGWVLKNYNYAEWWKVKPTRSVDCVVTGFKDGDGKYIGLVGSLLCSVYLDDGDALTEIARVSGMTDDQRVDVNEKKDLGRVVEVEYQDVGNGGRLIHPRFARWRDDKPAVECRYARDDL